jgi:hypothetical protein
LMMIDDDDDDDDDHVDIRRAKGASKEKMI